MKILSKCDHAEALELLEPHPAETAIGPGEPEEEDDNDFEDLEDGDDLDEFDGDDEFEDDDELEDDEFEDDDGLEDDEDEGAGDDGTDD